MQNIIIGSIPLLVAFVVSIFVYKKLEPKWLQLFSWFLMVTFVIQTSAYLYIHLLHKKSNHFIFNIYTLIDYVFYIYIFYKAVSSKRPKRVIMYAGIFFVTFYIIELFFLNNFFIFNPLLSNTGEFITLCCCLLYLAELIMAEKYINFFSLPMFWITTGILFSCVGDFFYLIFFNYILTNNLDPEGNIYGILMTLTSIIEYGFFIIAFVSHFLWKKVR